MRRDRAVVAVLAALVGCTGDIDTGSQSGPAADARAGQADGAPGSPDATPGAADAAGNPPGEPARLAGITVAHNQVRDTVGVPHVTWDPDLAAIAQAWAEKCIDNEPIVGLIDHNPDRSADYPGYVGENIYGSGGNATGQGAVDLWAGEAQYYDYDTNSCQAGQVCGHYTQLVWRDTSKLGCGIHDCPGLTYGSSVVCNYAPGGNTGGKPY